MWRIVLELCSGLALLVLGAGFWAVVKSPRFFEGLLADSSELRAFTDFLGTNRIVEEARDVEPVFGSYGANIDFFTKVHLESLRRTRAMVLALAVPMILGSYLLGAWYMMTNAVVFLLPGVFPIPASAKNNTVTLVHTIALNIHRWHEVESIACFDYCTRQNPRLAELHTLVTNLARS